jgi:hypothetical protein
MNSPELYKLRIHGTPMPVQIEVVVKLVPKAHEYMMHYALLNATFLSVLQVHL